MYNVYCSGQGQSISKFNELNKNPSFVSTLKRCESDSQCRGLKLKDFLIKPVQRICKYPLFFSQLIKFTDESEPAFLRLKACLSKIEETTKHINEFRRDTEKNQRVVEIQDNFDPPLNFELVQLNRFFVREAEIQGKIGTSPELTPLQLFMFNDLLLITRKKSERNFSI